MLLFPRKPAALVRPFVRHLAGPARARLGAAGIVAALLAPALRAQPVFPEALPDPKVPGFHFPESEATLTSWISAMTRGVASTGGPAAADKISLHGWGLWTSLTTETAQVYEGQRLRVFETWLTPEDLAGVAASPTGAAALALHPRRRAALRTLDQLKNNPMGAGMSALALGDNLFDRVAGFVKFDPSAAEHIVRQRLLDTAALDALLQGGAQQIPAFPATALVVKPVFQIVKAGDLVGGRYYALKVWPGPPELAQPWPPSRWPGCVWLDLLDGGDGQSAIDEAPQSDGSTRTDTTTYPVSALMNYRLSAVDAAALNADKPGTGAAAGDVAILVAMHVAGRETARWIWQTFWWTPTPDDPHAPSSPAIASQRPAQLRGAARNYAMALAYTMVTPDQPYIGGENTGAAVYAYNPWIEARFGPADLPDSQPGLDPSGRPAANNCGIQTNCMSCHAQATYNPNKLVTAPRFTGARYVDLVDPHDVGTLQVDFLWSIPRNAAALPPPLAASPQPTLAPSPDSAAPIRFPVPSFNPSQDPKLAQP